MDEAYIQHWIHKDMGINKKKKWKKKKKKWKKNPLKNNKKKLALRSRS